MSVFAPFTASTMASTMSSTPMTSWRTDANSAVPAAIARTFWWIVMHSYVSVTASMNTMGT